MKRRLVDLKREYLPKLELQALWKENEVFSRLLHRGRNQHRHDKSFQMMTRVRRDLNKYQLVNIFTKMKELIEKLLRAGASQTVSSTTASWTIAPSTVQLATEAAWQLLECAVFIAELLCFTEDTWREVHQRLVLNRFVPYNLLMLACLSRIWYCLRYHLLGVAEVYHFCTANVLSASILSSVELPGSVKEHLRECHRKYLTTPTSEQLVPEANGPGLSMQESVASGCQSRGGGLATARSDLGVAVALSSAEQQARRRDFVSTQLPLHGNQQPANPTPTPPAPVKATREGERWKKLYLRHKRIKKALRKGKMRRKVKEEDVVKTARPGKKKRRYSRRGRKRLLKRRLAREKALKETEDQCEGRQETVQDLQAQFQQQMESAALDVGRETAHSPPHTAHYEGEGEGEEGGGDEIDRIFHSLQ